MLFSGQIEDFGDNPLVGVPDGERGGGAAQRGETRRIAGQALKQRDEGGTGEILFFENFRRTALDELHRVVELGVFRDVRGRDED